MKKLLNFGCNSIAYNENYICASGNIIETLRRNYFEKELFYDRH